LPFEPISEDLFPPRARNRCGEFAQVVVAMDADAQAGGSGGCDGVGTGEEVDAARKEKGGVIGGEVFEGGELDLQGLQRGGNLAIDSLCVVGQILIGERLGGKGRVGGGGGEGEVHFRGAVAEERGGPKRWVRENFSFAEGLVVIEKTRRRCPG